jgi:hypothetical protein
MKTNQTGQARPKTAKKPTKQTAKKPDPKKDKVEERIAKANAICELYESGNVTIESCCEEHGIAVRTFWNWANENAEISARYKKAKEQHGKVGKEGLREKALDGLGRLLMGYWVEETETMVRKGAMACTETKTKKRFIGPNATAVIFALKTIDPANWGETNQFETSGEAQVFKIGEQIITFT